MLTLGENSYITLAAFKSWADARLKDYSSFTDTQIEAAVVVASVDFIDVSYKFKGVALVESQSMQLPTDLVTIENIENAAAQATWQALNNELFISPTANSSGQVIKQRDKLDVLESEVEFAANSAAYYKHSTSLIDGLLRKYTVGSGMGKLKACWS